MYKKSTDQLTLTFNLKKKKKKALMLLRFLPKLVKCATALNNSNNSLFLWLKKKEKKKKRQGVFCYLLTFNITYNTTSNMGLSHLNSQPGSSYSSEEYQKTAQNI